MKMNDATNSRESLQAEIHDLAVAIKADSMFVIF